MKNNTRNILKILEQSYPEAKTSLDYSTTYELLVATVLSAQTTDKQVNKATKILFASYNTPEEFADLTEEQLSEYIKGCGMYKTKSRNIIRLSRILVEEYNSEVPGTMDELLKLPGVGRKTANVVLSNAFGKNAIAVDTHVFRVSNRLGLADSKNVLNTEKDLMAHVPKKEWVRLHHQLIYHGRRICKARKPDCNLCPLKQYCKYAQER